MGNNPESDEHESWEVEAGITKLIYAGIPKEHIKSSATTAVDKTATQLRMMRCLMQTIGFARETIASDSWTKELHAVHDFFAAIARFKDPVH